MAGLFSQDSRGIVAGFWSRDIRRADGVAAAPLDLLANDDNEDDHEKGDEKVEEEEEKDGTGSGPGLPANGGEGSRVRGRSTDRRL